MPYCTLREAAMNDYVAQTGCYSCGTFLATSIPYKPPLNPRESVMKGTSSVHVLFPYISTIQSPIDPQFNQSCEYSRKGTFPKN